jgi:uncharacterized iron-regulated membrane protein
MKKNIKLNQWLWKWHFIAGLISLPIILLLSVTGGIYLFKADYEKPIHKPIKEVVVKGAPISYQQQWEIANASMSKKPNAMILPKGFGKATEFVSGKFSHKSSLFVNPYTSEVSGIINANEGLMHKVRKLHGELLTGKIGTKIVELVASWMIVLILTGIFIFWPERKRGLTGFFVPRIRQGIRLFFRDMHAISGFWISGLLLITLAGAFPWTDVVGENFKWVQQVTHTGYPKTWQGIGVESEPSNTRTSLDEIVEKTRGLSLPGEVSIEFPKGENGVFSIGNTYHPDLSEQKKYHFDRYNGKQVLQQYWSDVGVLMRGRMWVMAFHQGQFGLWNWYLMLFTAVLLALVSISAIYSYLFRKKKGNWGVPKVPGKFKVGYSIIVLLIVLGVLLPLFGASMLLIIGGTLISDRRKSALEPDMVGD